jgi:hypothetical protein
MRLSTDDSDADIFYSVLLKRPIRAPSPSIPCGFWAVDVRGAESRRHAGALAFDGETTVSIDVLEPTESITLNALPA